MGQYEDTAAKFFRTALSSELLRDTVRERQLAELFAQYASQVPRAEPDTLSAWREIDGAVPEMLERVYTTINAGTRGEMNLVGNVVNYRAGASWMLVVNGRIIRQSELIEGPEPMGDAKRACDDFRDRIVAMWNS